jgi:hypothetical protein
MAVYVNGKAVLGTERRSSSREKKDRVRVNRFLWKANGRKEGHSGIDGAPMDRIMVTTVSLEGI